jgi:hypothetical protein
MKWKKYLYRTICGDSGYALCSAPSCAECADFDGCFGEETGESFLARARRSAETAARSIRACSPPDIARFPSCRDTDKGRDKSRETLGLSIGTVLAVPTMDTTQSMRNRG